MAVPRALAGPSDFPRVAGLEMAGRYVPGTGQVGGDWYDVFPLPSGEVGAVIGDVAGTGLRAAVIMGRIRSALRACALEATDPADVLTRLDAEIQHFEAGPLATVLYAVFDPGLRQVRISCAGHLPPVISRPGERPHAADVAADLMLGVAAGAPRRTCRLAFPPGSSLCLFTDGLVERRGLTLDEGIARLCRGAAARDPEAACLAVMAAASGSAPRGDDVALLILHRPPVS